MTTRKKHSAKFKAPVALEAIPAARTLLDAGVFGSTMTLNSIETAALDACCSRATDCENVSRRA